MNYQRLSNSKFRELFSPASMLPTSDKSSFEIDDLRISIQFDTKTRIATWTKSYSLSKVRDAHEGDDWWWEVTGCPGGKILHAKGDQNGYGYETFLDERSNLVHWIDLRKRYPIGTQLALVVELETSGHEKEDKLLVMERVLFFKKFLFRYDLGYSCPVAAFAMRFKASNGTIVQAWPRQLSNPTSGTEVEITKPDGLRARQVFSPLIQIESGSRIFAKATQLVGSFLGGVLIGVSGNYVYAQLPGDHNGKSYPTIEQSNKNIRSTHP
ncbi:MAG: hypothetical protein K9J74_03390 [Sulfuritalea sp.]|nr:hypothetical protein [Sulfuritalea sp.]